MYMLRPVVVFACLVAGCGPTPVSRGATPAGQRAPEITQIPESIGAFRRIETHQFDDPSAGAVRSYRNGSALQPDVYVYPLTETARAGGEDPLDRAEAESRIFPVALEVERQRGRFDRFQVRADSAVAISHGSRTIRGWHTAVQLSRRGDPRDSHQYLFALGDQFVKVRITYVPGAVKDEDRVEFIRALLIALLPPLA